MFSGIIVNFWYRHAVFLMTDYYLSTSYNIQEVCMAIVYNRIYALKSSMVL